MQDVHRVIKIALLCIQMASENRPTMARIVSMLQGYTQSEVVVPVGAAEDQVLNPVSGALGSEEIGLTTVPEESQLSNLSSYDGFGSGSHQHNLPGNSNVTSVVELRQIRAR